MFEIAGNKIVHSKAHPAGLDDQDRQHPRSIASIAMHDPHPTTLSAARRDPPHPRRLLHQRPGATNPPNPASSVPSREVVASGLVGVASGKTKVTQDVDFFTDDETCVRIAAAALIKATSRRGWACEVVRDTQSFQRLRLSKLDVVLAIDLATDTAAVRPLIESRLGPTFDPLEHAARKALALFDRAAERDCVDLHQLAQTIDKADILALATVLDLGFDRVVFAEMLRAIKRFNDDDLPCDVGTAAAVRMFADQWADELDPRH